jgi:REase_AHJR-like
MTPQRAAIEAETAVLEGLRESYEARGFKFVLRPPRDLLPTPFGSYQPDAIALGPKSNVAIEVISSNSKSKRDQVEQLSERVRSAAGWDMVVMYAPSSPSDTRGLQPFGLDTLREELADVSDLAGSRHVRSAFVAAWGLLEAVVRAAEPSQAAGRSLLPREIVQILLEGGYLSEDDGKRLRRLIRLRNSVVHGGLEETVTVDNVRYLVSLISKLLRQLSPHPS